MLGDYLIATLSPLKFRVYTNPKYSQRVTEDGKATVRIGKIELYCDDSLITEPREQNIALFLMLYGDWGSNGGEVHIENSELIYFDFVSQPMETNDEQDFQFIGKMSGMVSRRFNTLTVEEGAIERLSPQTDISDIGIKIPDEYEGKVLHLWRLVEQQSDE